jgi:hypothetical protein
VYLLTNDAGRWPGSAPGRTPGAVGLKATVVVSERDDFRPLYRTMLAVGTAAIFILALGFLFFLRFAPPGEGTGLRARVEGVYAYDPSTHTLHGPSTTFAPGQAFAARVDWSSLPSTVIVGAHWYNSLEQELGGVAPRSAGALARDGTLVVQTPPQGGANLPGQYTMVVARYSHGQAVELLARTSVLVERMG